MILNLVLLSTVLFTDHPHITRRMKLVKGLLTTEKQSPVPVLFYECERMTLFFPYFPWFLFHEQERGLATQISSEITLLALPPLSCTFLPSPLRIPSIFDTNFQPAMLAVHSELAYLGSITSSATNVNSFKRLCVNYDTCALNVFNFWHLCLPLNITSEKRV